MDSSALSGSAPSAIAAGLSTRKVPMLNGTPLMKLVAIDWKYCCCSDGARKPVDIVLRSAILSVNA
ncbi:hypothetical protein D3C71_2242960 [compost metagenome]